MKNAALKRSLKKLERSLERSFDNAMDEIVEKVEKESKKLAPFKSGELQGNVETDVKKSSDKVIGTVQYNVKYAARQHQDLSLRPGPGTRSKSQTKYGTPGTGYLENAAKGLGKDKSMHKIIEREVKKIR